MHKVTIRCGYRSFLCRKEATLSIRLVDRGHDLREEFERIVHEAQVRYEMLSADMARALADGSERETEDKLRWMYAFHALQSLTGGQTHTDGTLGITTDLSTSNGLNPTGS